MIGHNNELTDNDRTQLMMQTFIYSVHPRQNNDKTDNFRQTMIRQYNHETVKTDKDKTNNIFL